MSGPATLGVISSGHEETTRTAATMLEAGGNAFDAAVAAGFVASLAEPSLTSLGGGGFLLVHRPGGAPIVFDFFVDTPGRGRPAGTAEPHFEPVLIQFLAAEQEFHVGLGAVAVPGMLKGLLHVHERLGRLPRADVLAPAIALARDGVVLNRHQAEFIAILEPILTLTPRAAALHAPGGQRLGPGDRMVNPEMAAFLAHVIVEGDREFYEGDIARAIADEMQAGGGLLTREDLAAYRVIERPALRSAYRGRTFLTAPPPAVGGAMVAMGLKLLERCDLRAVGWGSTEHLRTLLVIQQELERLRWEGCSTPDDITEERFAESLARLRPTGGTTHLNVADADGNVVAFSSSNGEGSGYLAPGTGIMLNNMLGEDDLHLQGFHRLPPGERVTSMMAPALLLDGDTVECALGSGGSSRIRSALLQTITGLIDFDLTLAEAVQAPRVHWDGAELHVEPGFADDAVEPLRHFERTRLWQTQHLYFGGVHAITPPTGFAADPRRSGHGCVVLAPRHGTPLPASL